MAYSVDGIKSFSALMQLVERELGPVCKKLPAACLIKQVTDKMADMLHGH